MAGKRISANIVTLWKAPTHCGGSSSAPDERGKTYVLNPCLFVAKEVIHEPN